MCVCVCFRTGHAFGEFFGSRLRFLFQVLKLTEYGPESKMGCGLEDANVVKAPCLDSFGSLGQTDQPLEREAAPGQVVGT